MISMKYDLIDILAPPFANAHFTGVPDTNSPGSQEPRISKTESTAHVSDLTSDKFCRFRPIVQNSVLPRYGSPAIRYKLFFFPTLTRILRTILLTRGLSFVQ